MSHVRRRAVLLALLLPVSLAAGLGAPPAVPSAPDPANGAVDVSLDVTLSWAADPDARRYDVFFGATNPPPLVGSANNKATYRPGALAPDTTYYWKVDARGTAGSSASGPIWAFTTIAQPPAGPPLPPPASVSRLKVMTWNIQGGLDAGGAEAIDAQAALMIDANADVIGLHELEIAPGRDLRALYKARLEAATGVTWSSVWAPVPLPAGMNPGGNLVLSRLPIVSSSTVQFDTAPGDNTWLGAKRSAAMVELAVNGKHVYVFFTHLDTDVAMRSAQLQQLLAWVNTYPPPRLLGGDFNMMPSETDYSTTTSYFDDAWWSLVERFQGPPGPDRGYTKNVRGIAPWTGQPGRIDYWFHEKESPTVRPTEIAVLETQRSDHHAVIVWVAVQ